LVAKIRRIDRILVDKEPGGLPNLVLSLELVLENAEEFLEEESAKYNCMVHNSQVLVICASISDQDITVCGILLCESAEWHSNIIRLIVVKVALESILIQKVLVLGACPRHGAETLSAVGAHRSWLH
jgi:hypothetical protein